MKKSIILTAIVAMAMVSCKEKPVEIVFEKMTFEASNGITLPYQVHYPESYSFSEKCPLLLFLHGAGERGDDNEAQMLHGGDLLRSSEILRNVLVIIPQCPKDSRWATKGGPWELDYNPVLNAPLAAVKELLDCFVKTEVADPAHIYATGLSMGAMGTFDLTMAYPDFFAAVTPICGTVNAQEIDEYDGNTVFRIYHGEDDPVVDPKGSYNAYETLKAHGKNVTLTTYPGVKHNSWDNVFAEPDYLSWFFQYQATNK